MATDRWTKRSPFQDLLLVATGRPAGLNGVTGAGVSLLRNRLTGE